MELANALRTIPLFRGLSDEDVAAIAERGRPCAVDTGVVLFAAGDAADCLYVVVSGTVRVYLREDDHETHLAILGDGDYFGELALIDGGTRSASVATLAPSR